MTGLHGRVVLGEAAARAVSSGTAVVALETTVVTHGLPHPRGLAAAFELEAIVRSAGATPATIGVLDGAIRVGLTPEELSAIAGTPEVVKVNSSNLAAVLASGGPGSATVAVTMFAAHACGLRVFATGGIGGVHRDVSVTGDVSADLTALSRIPVAVVCAGAKAILDLPRTLETLETLGVPVVGLGTSDFPAFYRRSSGLRVDWRADSVAALAQIVQTHFELGFSTGVLVANPVPAEDEMSEMVYTQALETALSDAAAAQVRGRAVTPFLLRRMFELTGGESVRVNLALLRHNARVAAELARALVARD